VISYMVLVIGLEPITTRLQGECSTD